MLVKVFSSRGPFNGFHGKLRHRGNEFYTLERTLSLEAEINQWLAQNPAIVVKEVRQSLAFGWFGRQSCVVTLWYEPPKLVLTKEAAERLVLAHVNKGNHPEEVVITEVIERSFGWVFCYNSRRYIETGDDKHCLLGSYPILVDRRDCTLHFTGIGRLEEYIERFEKTGDTKV